MEYIVLDLEFNAAYSKTRHRFVNEIIEFGAVKLDEQLNIIDTFSELVTPQISKKLNTHVAALTHITIDELNKEFSLRVCQLLHSRLILSHKTFLHKFHMFFASLVIRKSLEILIGFKYCPIYLLGYRKHFLHICHQSVVCLFFAGVHP